MRLGARKIKNRGAKEEIYFVSATKKPSIRHSLHLALQTELAELLKLMRDFNSGMFKCFVPGPCPENNLYGNTDGFLLSVFLKQSK